MITGSLYLAMMRLEKGALIAEAKRPAGEADDPRRRYYKLTANGVHALADARGRAV